MEEALKAMATVNVQDVTHDLRPFLVVYKDGRVQRFTGTQHVPASTDTVTGVESLDVAVLPEEEGGVSVRLYKPAGGDVGRLPVLIYIHGGGFCIESAASPMYHNYLNGLCSKANVLVVSVDYRLAPEHPVPAAYEDSWAAINWVGKGDGQDVHPWIKDRADLSRVFLAGDSAGANIAHHMVKRLGKEKIENLGLKGVILVHPYFWGKDKIGSELQKIKASGGNLADELWGFVCPGTSGLDDPFINPATDPELADLAVEKVMVCVAELDTLRDRGFQYKEVLQKSGCKANVEVVETLGESHVFHLLTPGSPNAAPFMDQVVAFLNSS
ncbi:probable carboxylesterase 2 [Chenopodium quinoa]|uniref:Alpha/beta hydrolase fold-3 domain-containing protein n=1 Tax=Chenopodium quinoa TaxID=63459 RepID=A0A803LNU4_CHEQI|nr:probable carboxylesterase 2 [Chenopodium quinoa]